VFWEDTAHTLAEKIPAKHKFTETSLAPGDTLVMYGVSVGKATRPIAKGGLVSTANTVHHSDTFTLRERKTSWAKPDVSRWEDRTFLGYYREDGSVGTANYWLVIPMVFCENRNVSMVRDLLVRELGYSTGRKYELDVRTLVSLYQQGKDAGHILETNILQSPTEMARKRIFPNIDGIKLLTHEGGCGGTRMDAEVLCKLLAGYIQHPNVAGATVLSLGCQHAQVEILQKALEERAPHIQKPLVVLEQQQSESEPALISEAVKRTFLGMAQANEKDHRSPAPLSKLMVGLECGGSDGFSGISANPAVGHASDLLVALGGSVALSEFPELCGVEQELSDRCVTESIATRFMELMTAYNSRAEALGSGFHANPSPGNIKDGLITDAIKSAGAAKKGGTSPVVDVLDYAEPITKPGLNLLCTPGNDVESTTGLAGSGCQIILFTTGLGTPTGNPVAPTLKISTNTALFQRMPDIIDINAGTIITGEDTIETKGEEILEMIIRTASGEYTPKAVALAQDDFIPWKRGISL
jgi:altronate hydrolase